MVNSHNASSMMTAPQTLSRYYYYYSYGTAFLLRLVWLFIGVYDSQIVYNHYRRVCLPRLVTQLVGEYVEGGPEDYGAPGRRVATLNWF